MRRESKSDKSLHSGSRIVKIKRRVGTRDEAKDEGKEEEKPKATGFVFNLSEKTEDKDGKPKSLFGNPTGGSLFGNGSTSLFGNKPAEANGDKKDEKPAGSLFGNTNTGGSLFGNSKPEGGGLFGSFKPGQF